LKNFNKTAKDLEDQVNSLFLQKTYFSFIDDIVYIPGLPDGISVDCGIRFANYFGRILSSNTSIFDPRSTGKLLQTPAAKSKLNELFV